MDDRWSDAEANMRQSLASAAGTKHVTPDDPQRLARQIIRSQVAARELAQQRLSRARRIIGELHRRLQAAHREKAFTAQAIKAAHNAEAQANRAQSAAEAALLHQRTISDRAQRELRQAQATIQDLTTKLALAHRTAKALQTTLELERQAVVAAAQTPRASGMPTSVGDESGLVNEPSIKRKRERPVSKGNASAPARTLSKAGKGSAGKQKPVQWWSDGWKPRI